MTRPHATEGPNLSIDQQHAMRTAATRLAREFTSVVNPRTIERFLASSYDEFAATASVTRFLPMLAERFARQRLTALAKLEGKAHTRTPVVSFLCTHNAGRSQMAVGFFTHPAGSTAIAWSGGTEPAGQANPAAVAAMAERGIDISAEYPKPWTEEIVRAADVIVSMGCGDACPHYPGHRYLEGDLADPAGLEVHDIRPILDDFECRVRDLISELGVTSRQTAAGVTTPGGTA